MRALLCTAGLLFAIARVAITAELFLFEKLDSTPRGWTQGSAVPALKPLRFRIALRQEAAHEFEQHVIQISTPGHAKYGQHMSREELKRAIRPSSDASRSVLDWLRSAGIRNVEDDGDWIGFVATTEEAERILDTKFHYYLNQVSGIKAIRTLQYSVPDAVAAYVQMIQPTTRFGQLSTQLSGTFVVGEKTSVYAENGRVLGAGGISAVNDCNASVTPDCLRKLYGVGEYTADPNSGSRLGICGYLKEYAQYADLERFLHTYAPQQSAEENNFTYVLINGGRATQNGTAGDNTEGNLDVQYAMSMAYHAKTTYYSTGGVNSLVPDLDQPQANNSLNEPYLDFLHYILALPDYDLPQTLTTSYGEDEQSILPSYTNATCSLFAQLGARGVSVIFSSGDTGVGSACQTNDGKNTTRFLPFFPASCPFVTSVGGTEHISPERATSFSSGGFSNRFARHAYQDAAVGAYLAILGDRWKGLYNPAGRGIPDVAAQASGFSIVDHGEIIQVSGTSAAAPTFAGIVSLLNSARLSAGRKPLGFLNPWIYASGFQGLTDITEGGSSGCTGEDIYSQLPTPLVPFASWNATKGWDPVTGYGTPLFPALLKLAMAAL